MRDDGYLCQVVERWNQFARCRQDLFGIIDIVCIKEGSTVGVQSTTRSNIANHRTKMENNENFKKVKKAGWELIIHGWAKNKKNRYEVKEIIL